MIWTAPNGWSAQTEAARVVLLFDRKPSANNEITPFRSARVHDGKKIAENVRSAASKFAPDPPEAGTCRVLARHGAAVPAGSPMPIRSFACTLAFDAA